MRGHEAIVAMRRRGMRPEHVTLTDQVPLKPWSGVEAFPEVGIERADNPDRIDLRFLVGLPVFVKVFGDEPRMRRLVAAAERAGAEFVTGCVFTQSGEEPQLSVMVMTHAKHEEGREWRS